MLIDYHIHTNTSLDAIPTVAETCEKAASIGLKEICITNHHELGSVWSGTYNYALSEYKMKKLILEIEECRNKFDLQIRLGAEIGYYEGYEKELISFISKYPFDYIIGGIHFVEGTLIVSETPLLDADEDFAKTRYIKYFKLLKKAINSGFFDCVAHFDLPKKELPFLKFSEYKKEVSECINAMKSKNIGFELNTSGWRRYHKEQYPGNEVLRLLKKAGIKKITIGSDSHNIDELGNDIDRGISVLKENGFKQICTFNKRKPLFHNICGKQQ